MSKQKFMVTSALPYANGPLHLGHIAGAYLPADIFVRFQRLIGSDILFICGTDEHGVPITISAEKEGITPRAIVKRYHEDIKKAFTRLHIDFDNFSGTSNVHNKHHARLSREFFMKLHKNKLISNKLEDQHFCPQCNRFLADRYIEGNCPKCDYPEARGDECSNCNYQFDPLTLKNPKCKVCGATPEVKPTKHWYLKLNILQKELEYWIQTKTYWKDNVVNFVKGWFKEGLRERAVTRDLYWGVPVPFDDAAGKVLYVWFDAPIGYISATMEWAEKQGDIEHWKDYWKNPDCNIVHFIGKDNIPFHAIIWPAMLAGQRDNYELPWHIPANEFLNFGFSEEEETSKASTSKGNVIWAHDCLDAFAADYIRYYLAANSPEKNDSIFTWKDFQSKCNNELLGVLGNLANRVLKFIASNFKSKVPAPGSLVEQDEKLLAEVRSTVDKVRNCYENFEVRRAVAEIVSLGRLGNQYLNEREPWKTVKNNREDCATCLYVCTQLVHSIAVMLAPIIPESAQKLWHQLGHKDDITSWEEVGQNIAEGHKIGKPEGIFDKIENDKIAPLEEKLRQAIRPKNVDAKSQEMPPFKEEIAYDDFARLDVRIAKILEAKKVKKADKLLQLQVEIGGQTRQVIAGIAQYYKPEEIVGKKIPILTNLKPAKIRGLVSEGMVLCAEADGGPVLLEPEKDISTGAVIR